MKTRLKITLIHKVAFSILILILSFAGIYLYQTLNSSRASAKSTNNEFEIYEELKSEIVQIDHQRHYLKEKIDSFNQKRDDILSLIDEYGFTKPHDSNGYHKKSKKVLAVEIEELQYKNNQIGKQLFLLTKQFEEIEKIIIADPKIALSLPLLKQELLSFKSIYDENKIRMWEHINRLDNYFLGILGTLVAIAATIIIPLYSKKNNNNKNSDLVIEVNKETT